MIELIINNGVITVNKKINILPINTEKMKINNALVSLFNET